MDRMTRLLLAITALCSVVSADVYLEEELTHSGIGPRKTGARQTVRRIYLKGPRQRMDSRIEASQAVERQLRAQGKRLEESTILQLDSSRVYAIDPVQSVYTREPLPAPKPVLRVPRGVPANRPPEAPAPARPDTAADANREIHFRSRVLADTLRLHGILCRRVAAELRARHYQPGTKTVVRENRYLYQAWMAADVPGHEEIRRFRELQRRKTSYPSLLAGGLDQVRDAMDEGDRLSAEIEALEGFPMQSELRVSVKTAAGGETPVFTLSRRIRSLSYTPLPDSLFKVTDALRLEEE